MEQTLGKIKNFQVNHDKKPHRFTIMGLLSNSFSYVIVMSGLKEMGKRRAGKMAQLIRVLAAKGGHLSNSQKPHGRRREPIPASCSLASTCHVRMCSCDMCSEGRGIMRKVIKNEDSRGHRVHGRIISMTEIKPDNIEESTGNYTLSSFSLNSEKITDSLNTPKETIYLHKLPCMKAVLLSNK